MATPTAGIKPRALVSDDSMLVRWALSQALARRGLEVVLASTRHETLCRLMDGPFLILVMSCSLGNEDTRDVIGALADEPGGTPVIVLCGGDCGEQFQSDHPSAKVFLKPFSLEAILSAVAEADDASHARLETA